jgi:hypothetical protein
MTQHVVRNVANVVADAFEVAALAAFLTMIALVAHLCGA